MLSLEQFKEEVLLPTVSDFVDAPTSLGRAYCAIWAVDSFGSHAAWASTEVELLSNKRRKKLEVDFKDRVCAHTGGWRFKVLREVSNASKHAVRSTSGKAIVTDSGKSSQQNVKGWSWYFQNSKYWGDQIVVELNLTWNEEIKQWCDNDGNLFRGPFFNAVPLLDLLEPSISLVEAQINEASGKVTPPTAPPSSH